MTFPGGKWLGWLLAGSLAVNLFGGGILLGGWIRDWRDPPAAGRAFHLGPPRLDILRMAERLPEPARAEARQILERRGGEIGAAFRALHRARREAHDALIAVPYEPNRLTRAFDELRARSGDAHARVHAAMVELIERVDPETRRLLAERMTRQRGRHGRRRHDGPPPPPPPRD